MNRLDNEMGMTTPDAATWAKDKLSYGALLTLTEGKGTSDIYERIQTLLTLLRAYEEVVKAHQHALIDLDAALDAAKKGYGAEEALDNLTILIRGGIMRHGYS